MRGRQTVLFFMGMSFFWLIAAAAFAQGDSDIQAHPACRYCGMDRKQFAHSRMLVVYEDGSTGGTCSLHCMAIELALQIDKSPKEIHIGDYLTRNLIDAERAIWVLGGDKPGVMTQRAKWAFQSKEGADGFIREHGGTVASIDEAMKGAYEDMYADTKQIRERRKMRRMRMEEKK